MKKKIALLIAGQLMVISQAFASGIAGDLGDKKAWETLNWAEFDRAKIMQRSEWSTAKASRNASTAYRTVQFDFMGQSFELIHANAGVGDASTPANQLTVARTDEGQGTCGTLLNWARQTFGSQFVDVDLTTGINMVEKGTRTPLLVVKRAMQWDVGSTRITLDCFGFDSDQAVTPSVSLKAPGFLNFSNIDGRKKLSAPFALTCKGRLKIAGAEDSDLRDATLQIFEYSNQVLGGNNQVYGVDHQITPHVISYSLPLKDGKTDFSINRITGAYNGTGKNSFTSWTIAGQCEKVDLKKPKF